VSPKVVLYLVYMQHMGRPKQRQSTLNVLYKFQYRTNSLNLVCEKSGMVEMYSLYVYKAQNCMVCKYLCDCYLLCNMISIYIARTLPKIKVPILTMQSTATLYS